MSEGACPATRMACVNFYLLYFYPACIEIVQLDVDLGRKVGVGLAGEHEAEGPPVGQHLVLHLPQQ